MAVCFRCSANYLPWLRRGSFITYRNNVNFTEGVFTVYLKVSQGDMCSSLRIKDIEPDRERLVSISGVDPSG